MRSTGPLLVILLGACGGSDGKPPFYPEDYADTFQQVRNCRQSADHDLHRIRVLAGPTALEAYNTRTGQFPLDALIVKEEYDFTDENCEGEVIEWTAMKRQEGATFKDQWLWQRVDKSNNVIEENNVRCINCHAECGVPPDGFDGTCALP